MNRDYTSNMTERSQPAEKRTEVLGGIEHHVKVRGFRIEPGEIESAISRVPGVKQCIAVVRENSRGDKQLIAYLAGDHQSLPSVTELRNFLKEKLPSYMIPAMFVKLEEMPRSPDGKVDRLALPTVDPALLAYGEVFIEPSTPSEELLAEIWSDLLGVTRIGVNDNFFELGGHSQLVAEIISRVNREFRVALPVNALFDFPTVAELALVIEAMLLEKSREISREHPAVSVELPIQWSAD